MKQDSRVTIEALPHVEMLFEFISGNDDHDMTRLLNIFPDLVYARDENGSTPLIAVIASGTQADLETARIIMRYNPDLTMVNNFEIGPWQAVQCMSERSETSIQLVRDFLKLLDPNVKFREYGSSNDAHKNFEAYMAKDSTKQIEGNLNKLTKTSKTASSDSYSGSNSHKQAVDHNSPEGGCCTIMSVTDITYDDKSLNQKIQKGFFSALNFNPNFDQYNFDPKSLAKIEAQAPEISQLNFNTILPNQEEVAPNTSSFEQISNILGDFSLSSAGVVSMMALFMVIESV